MTDSAKAELKQATKRLRPSNAEAPANARS